MIRMFGPKLDSLTLLLSLSALGFAMAAIASITSQAMPGYRPALRAWTFSMLAAGVGFFLIHMRGHLPWFLSFAVGNTLVMLVAAYGLVAHSKLLDARMPRTVIQLSLATGISGVVATYAFGAPLAFAVSAVSAAMAALFGQTAFILGRAAYKRFHLLTVVSTAVIGSVSAALVLRSFISGFGDPANVAATATATPQVGLFLLGIVYILTASLWILDTVHERQRHAALETARRDGLTGLCTRTYFFELASSLLKEHRGAPCAVVMVDIDHFKRINDNLGHAAGDTTLAHAARLIASAVRLSDVVGRYGGEEFCILLPNCNALQAAELAERLIEDAARQTIRLKEGKTVQYTLSAGYVAVELPDAIANPMDTLSALVEQADQALYRAKREGRNRAVAAPEAGCAVVVPSV